MKERAAAAKSTTGISGAFVRYPAGGIAWWCVGSRGTIHSGVGHTRGGLSRSIDFIVLTTERRFRTPPGGGSVFSILLRDGGICIAWKASRSMPNLEVVAAAIWMRRNKGTEGTKGQNGMTRTEWRWMQAAFCFGEFPYSSLTRHSNVSHSSFPLLSSLPFVLLLRPSSLPLPIRPVGP